MPCDTAYTSPGQSPAERREEIRAAVAELAALLASGEASVAISPTGAIAFRAQGWDRRRVADVCAAGILRKHHGAALQRAIQRAEATSGRKVNWAAVTAGTHSHDGGQTWHAGH